MNFISPAFSHLICHKVSETETKYSLPCYLYCLSSHRWGDDAAEFFAVLLHAQKHNYIPLFVADTKSRNIRRLNLLMSEDKIPREFFCIRDLFSLNLDTPETSPANWKQWLSYKSQISDSPFAHLLKFEWSSNLYWPYANYIKLSIHSSPFVHCDFSIYSMNRSRYDSDLFLYPLDSIVCNEELSFLELRTSNSFDELKKLHESISCFEGLKIGINIRNFTGCLERNSSIKTFEKLVSVIDTSLQDVPVWFFFYGDQLSPDYSNILSTFSPRFKFSNLTSANNFLSNTLPDDKSLESLHKEQIALTNSDFIVSPDSGALISPYVCQKTVLILDAYSALPQLSRTLYCPRPITGSKGEPLTSYDSLCKCIQFSKKNPLPFHSNTLHQLKTALSICLKNINFQSSSYNSEIYKSRSSQDLNRLRTLNSEHYSIFPDSVYSRSISPNRFSLIE